jgi:hypothetical protein
MSQGRSRVKYAGENDLLQPMLAPPLMVGKLGTMVCTFIIVSLIYKLRKLPDV